MISCPIFFVSQRYPDAPAIEFDGDVWTYADVHRRILSLQHSLIKQDVKAGTVVAFLAKTHPQTMLLYWAIQRLGGVACLLNPALPEQAQHDCLLSLNEFGSCIFIKDPEEITLIDEPKPLPHTTLFSMKQWATLIQTSGSMGQPKFALHTYEQHYYSALGLLESLDIHSSSKLFVTLPLFHVGGLGVIHRAALAGACLFFSKSNCITHLEKAGISHVSMVPTQALRALESDRFNATLFLSLKYIVLGGASVSDALVENLKERGFFVHVSYGLTEMSSTVCLNGSVLPYRQALCEDGRIYVRGKTLFEGYMMDGFVHLPLTLDGWFATGDVGTSESLNMLTVLGRSDRVIISGGENIQPEDIEKALSSCDDILQAVVVAVSHPIFGQRPVAIIETKSGQPLREESLRNELKMLLPKFKCPDVFFPWPAWAKGMKPSLQQFREWVVKEEDKKKEKGAN
jgi:O-succinylbenzoic acid--CoA ligase